MIKEARRKEKEIKAIISRLEKLVKDRDMNLLNTGCTAINGAEERYLNDDLIDLRLLGAPCTLPLTYTALGNICYFEAAAEIVRQAKEYLHPVRTWLKAHWLELVSCITAISALIISIYK